MPDHQFADGDRVAITAAQVGVVRTTDPYRFTPIILNPGDAGVVSDLDGLPDGWLAIRPDVTDEDLAAAGVELEPGELLVAPVHPSMIELAP